MLRVVAGFLHMGARCGKRCLNALSNLGTERKAKSLAAQYPAGPITIDEDQGYRPFRAADCNLDSEVTALAQLARAWKADSGRSSGSKPFLRNIMRSEDVLTHPEILAVALDGQLLGAIARYLGQAPWLVNLQLWWTPPNQTAVRSQLFHYDHRDTRQAKIFLNLNDVDETAGPLHFIPVHHSAKVDRAVGYSQDRYSDEQVFSACSQSDVVRTVGPVGSGFIVDTARCLHYGSRGNVADRLVMMASFARTNCVDRGGGCEVLDPVREELVRTRYAQDPARAFALLGA